jgi:hypothetical protein
MAVSCDAGRVLSWAKGNMDVLLHDNAVDTKMRQEVLAGGDS